MPTASEIVRRSPRPGGAPQLEALAQQIAARPDVWSPLLDTTADTRTYAELHRDDELDVWALFWLPENDTGWHDHDGSSGAVHVVRGMLEEHALRVDGPRPPRVYAAGDTFTFGPAHIHRLTCAVPRAVSIHVYSPPLRRLGQYAVGDDGVLSRRPVSYEEELRPAGA